MHVPPDPAASAAAPIGFDDWMRVDIRIGTIVSARPLPRARRPSLVLVIDFGATIGRRKSCAQITEHHPADTLVGRQIAAVVNFPPRQIGTVMSEVLTLGFPDADGKVVLIGPAVPVPDGGRLF